MAGNTFGTIFRITTFGESHGAAIGVTIDGCPAGLDIDETYIKKELDRRKPGQSKITSQREETEDFQVLSGIFEGKSTGAPILIIIPNKDARSKDYERFKNLYRPSHADYTYEKKYGIRDYRGGGRSSARETASRVAAGAIAKLFLKEYNISIQAFIDSIGNVKLKKDYQNIDFEEVEKNIVRCPDKGAAEAMIKAIEDARKEKDSLGGTIFCVIKNTPVGLGEPVFDKLEADLAKAMLSINATKGFEIGSGFEGSKMKGSDHNDVFYAEKGSVKTKSNFSGGIQGGISNGEDIYFRVAFKPVATIAKPQSTVNKEGNVTTVEGKGRHDPCVVPRAVPIVEAMAALVLADHLLRNRSSKANPGN